MFREPSNGNDSIHWSRERSERGADDTHGPDQHSMMFLRLNKSCFKEVRDLNGAVAQNKTAAAECAERVADVEAAAANSVAALLL